MFNKVKITKSCEDTRKAFFLCLLYLLSLCSFAQGLSAIDLLGEKLTYDVKYGIFRVGKAEMMIDPEIHLIDSQQHYLVTFKAKSVGLLRFFYSNLDLCYESYVSYEEAHSLKTVREVYHGSKVDIQHDLYEYSDSLYIQTHKLKNDRVQKNVFDYSEGNVRGVLGTYVWFRQKGLSNLDRKETAHFYLINRLNQFELIPSSEKIDGDNEIRKYSMNFPGVPDISPDKEHYALILRNTGIPMKVRLGTPVGNFSFIYRK